MIGTRLRFSVKILGPHPAENMARRTPARHSRSLANGFEIGQGCPKLHRDGYPFWTGRNCNVVDHPYLIIVKHAYACLFTA